MRLNALYGSLLGALCVAAQQRPFTVPSAGNYKAYDEGLFTPIESLSTLSESHFTTIGHPKFPRHSVRIKKSTEFCDTTVNSYTGYIDIEARHLFFYFFESRRDPDQDDVILWTNGGPGCSSSLGLFMELGPCRILSPNGTQHHPESWNTHANIFFIDQPVGVGFSYADHGEAVSTTEEGAADIAAFVAIFFENFTKFRGRNFHMAGESYGGRYIPVYAAAVYDQNEWLEKEGMGRVNLKSVMIGNGITDFYTMMVGYYEISCSTASAAPVLSIAQCVRMKQVLPRCQKMLREGCIDTYDSINCGAAASFCGSELSDPFFASGKNPYDISKDCESDIGDSFCYPVTKHILHYLDQPSVRAALGVDPSLTSNFTFCSAAVGSAFIQHMDEYRPTYEYVAALLERGVDALIYVGKNDWICNHVGNEAWTVQLEWSGKEAFGAQEMREWEVDGRVAGRTRSARGLTYATVEGAGHMVPFDKPKEALALVNRWLAGEPL